MQVKPPELSRGILEIKMVETAYVFVMLVIAIISMAFGGIISKILTRRKNRKFEKSLTPEFIYKKLTENNKTFIDQPTHADMPARKMKFSLQDDPVTGKKTLVIDYENVVVPNLPGSGNDVKPVKEKDPVEKKKADRPKRKVPNYNKYFQGGKF